MPGLQQVTLRAGGPEQSVDLGAGGGTVTASGATVYYRDEPGVTVASSNGSIASGASATLYGTQFFATTADRADVQVSVPVASTPAFGAFTYSEYLVEVTSASATWAQLAGPSITIDAPSDNTLVAIMFQAELKADAAQGQVRLAGIDATTYQVLDRTGVTYGKLNALPGLGSGSLTLPPGAMVWPVSAGQHIIRPEHRHATGASTAYFRNQRMWVAVSR